MFNRKLNIAIPRSNGGAAGWLPDVAGARVAGARAGMCREDEGGGGA